MNTFTDERRFAPAVRQWHGDGHGPTCEWDTHRREEADRAEFARLLHAESWPVHEIALYLGCGRAFVVASIQDGLW